MEQECEVCNYLKNPIATYYDDEEVFLGSWEDGRYCVIFKSHDNTFRHPLLYKLKILIDKHIGPGRTLSAVKVSKHIILFIL